MRLTALDWVNFFLADVRGGLGAYVTVTLMGRGWPFFATLPCAFLVAAVVSVAFECALFRRVYRSSDLQQVLLTIGLAFISVAAAAWFYGTMQQPVRLPSLRTYLSSKVMNLAGFGFCESISG